MLFDVAHAESRATSARSRRSCTSEIDKLEQLSREGMSITGTPSGFRDIDDITGGFQKSNLIVLAARPSMGKSALVANIAENVAVKHGKPVALFSLEMSETELAQRFIASQARMSGDKLRKGQVAAQRLAEGDQGLRGARARRRSGSTTPPTSTSSSCARRRAGCTRRRQQRAAASGLIDRRLPPADARRTASTDSRVEQVGQISRGLKILARELDVPVIAVSQLNRSPEQRPDKRPLLSDLRESGQIEQDADLVMFIYRDEYYNPETPRSQGTAEINIAKHRNGPAGRTSSCRSWSASRSSRTSPAASRRSSSSPRAAARGGRRSE